MSITSAASSSVFEIKAVGRVSLGSLKVIPVKLTSFLSLIGLHGLGKNIIKRVGVNFIKVLDRVMISLRIS